ncbi:hypothetical protein BU16DRAFT_575483 [Lophium mytilinum]|uniref:DUF7730 domain-containing protein n=1 Tax=Lophium mytilinum TaxID=390894 RepID=A0A6A6QCG2_9PEZI|nr:hypothetical protein BU16DRAFT_575483 [Lophium mytilinum]
MCYCWPLCPRPRFKPYTYPWTTWEAPPRKRKTSKSLVPLYPRRSQTQSPLFGKLSTELRIIIYEAVLGDPVRLMHILPYAEAIDILYTANQFSLKGSTGIVAMLSVVPNPQWHMIRHLHISTMFFTPKRYYSRDAGQRWDFPPDDFNRWSVGCMVLQDLRGLYSLHVDIIVRDSTPPEDPDAVVFETLVSVLGPLKDIKAPVFEVEINLPIPNTVQTALGITNFTLLVHERPYNWDLNGETS